jgi:hypothetical protein
VVGVEVSASSGWPSTGTSISALTGRCENADRAATVVCSSEVSASCSSLWSSGTSTRTAVKPRSRSVNAWSHGGAGGRVVLRVDRSGPAIEVTDSGPGVAPGSQERIFERFERGPDAGEDGGFGLGLAIGRELARKMGGELALLPGGPGATFRATFPAAQDDA